MNRDIRSGGDGMSWSEGCGGQLWEHGRPADVLSVDKLWAEVSSSWCLVQLGGQRPHGTLLCGTKGMDHKQRQAPGRRTPG